jgi:enterochelin esterase-like enzyme
MSRKQPSVALALLSVAVVVACAKTVPTPTPASTPTFTTVPATPTDTPTLPPATPTLTPSATSTLTPQPPSATPSPSATPACETQGRIEVGTFFSAVIGREQPFRVYLPPCYGLSDVHYPVLYMLHGYPFDDSHWDEIGIDEAADAGIAAGVLPPFIIAMPSADNEGTFTRTSGGANSFEAVLLDEFVPFIESTFRVIDRAEGRAIGGMSRGGVWSLEIAFRHPDRFAAVGGHSVALNVNLAPPDYDPFYLVNDPAIRSLRIYLDVGEDDWTLGQGQDGSARPGMQDLHEALTAAGVAHGYHVYPGAHNDDYWSEHVAEYLAFYTADW